MTTVDSGGDLEIGPAGNLNLANGAGTDLLVNGTVGVAGELTQAGSTLVEIGNGGLLKVSNGGIIDGGGGNGSTIANLQVDSGGQWTIDAGGSMNMGGTAEFAVNSGGNATLNGPVSTGSSHSPTTIDGTVTASANITLASVSNLQVNGTLTMTAGTIGLSRGNGGSVGQINSGGSIVLQGSSLLTIGGVGRLHGGQRRHTRHRADGAGEWVERSHAASGSDLKIGSTAGITSSGATGSVQTSTRNFNTAANYTYSGTAAQVTGNGLPATVNNLTIANTGGTVTPTNSVRTDGTLSVLSGAKLQKFGAFTLTTGPGGVSNAGTIELSGTTAACGEADNLLIRSSAAGTQRPWSGAGVFTISDVDVQDQAGSAAIDALSSTNTGNNGANWNIIAGCTTNTPTTTTVSSSTNPSTFGQSVSFTATVSPAAATGSVQFVVDGVNFGSPVPVSGGTATSGTTSSLTVGNHPVTANFVGTGAYTDSSGTLSGGQTVNMADQTISFGALTGKTYGDADFNVSASATSGLAVTFTASGNCSVAGTLVHITGAGSCTVTAHQAGDTNYNAAPDVPQSFSIAKANATISVTPYSVTYDGAAHTATGTATGVGGADLSASLTLTGTTHTNAGTYNGDAWTFTGGANYNDANGTVDDAIAKANASISVTPYSVTYDGAAHTATGTATGVGGADLSAGLNLSGTTHTNAGTYNGDAWTFTGGTNYNDANGTVDDAIAKANATISVTPYSVTYDGLAHTATGTATGVGAADLSAGLNLTGTTHTNAGTYNGDAWTFTGGTNYNDANGTVDDVDREGERHDQRDAVQRDLQRSRAHGDGDGDGRGRRGPLRGPEPLRHDAHGRRDVQRRSLDLLRRDQLQRRRRLGQRQHRPGGDDDHLVGPGGHHLRHGPRRDAVERDGQRAGQLRLHAGGRDGSSGGRRPDPFGGLHADRFDQLQRLDRGRPDQRQAVRLDGVGHHGQRQGL